MERTKIDYKDIARKIDFQELAKSLGLPIKRKTRKAIQTNCVFHLSDTEPSLSFYQDNFYCFGCGRWGRGIKGALELIMQVKRHNRKEAFKWLINDFLRIDDIKHYGSKKNATETKWKASTGSFTGNSIDFDKVYRELMENQEARIKGVEYLASRGISEETGKNRCFVKDGVAYFPFLIEDKCVYIQTRAIQDKVYRNPAGVEKPLYILTGTDKKVYVCEGVIDALSLKDLYPNANVVGMIGVNDYEKTLKWIEEHFDKNHLIYLCCDYDSKGLSTNWKMKMVLENKGYKTIYWDKHIKAKVKDVNEYLCLLKQGKIQEVQEQREIQEKKQEVKEQQEVKPISNLERIERFLVETLGAVRVYKFHRG